MNDEYLKKLYGWIKTNDSSYESSYSYEQFSNKMKNGAYAQKMHGWVSDIDPTFISLDEFNSKIKKKSPDGGSTSGSGLSEYQKNINKKQEGEELAQAYKSLTGKTMGPAAENVVRPKSGGEYELKDNFFAGDNPELKKLSAELLNMKNATPTIVGGKPVARYTPSQIEKKQSEYNAALANKTNLEDDTKIKALNKEFGKTASLSSVYEEYDNFFKDEQAGAVKSFIEKTDPTKRGLLGNKTTFDLGLGNVDNNTKYRIKDNSWERLTPNSPSYEKIESAPSIKALNTRYGKDISTDVSTIVVKPKVIDPFLVINSDFLSKTEENALTSLEKKFGDDFIFEQTGLGTDYIKVTPKNGAESKTFSFDEKSSDEAIRLQSFLRNNASFEKGSSSAEKIIKKNIITEKDNNYDNSSALQNNKYYESDEYKQLFKELSYFQKRDEIKRRQLENSVVEVSDIGWEGKLAQSIFGEGEAQIKAKKEAKILNEKLYNSEEFKLYDTEKTKFEKQLADRYSLLLDEYEIKKQRGDKEGARQAKLKIESGFSKDVIGDNLTHLSNTQYDLMSETNNLIKNAEKLQERAENGLISEEEYNVGVEALIIEEARLKASAKEVSKTQREMNALAGIYVAEKAKYGGFGSNLWNTFIVATDEVREPLSYVVPLIGKDPTMSKAIEEGKKTKILTPRQKKYYEDKGYSEQQIKNVLINKAELSAIKANKKAVIEGGGFDLTTEESKSKLGFVQNSLVGVAASLPSMLTRAIPVVGQGLAFASMANMSYNAIEEEMLNDPDFETTSKADRAVVAVPYALVMGALENIGLKNMTAGKAGVAGRFILSRVAKLIPKGASREIAENIINSEVKNIFAKGGIKIVRGTMAEFETGIYQAAALDYGLKALYNELDPLKLKLTSEGGVAGGGLTGGEIFGTPDTKAGVAMSILEGGVAEAIGGFAMSTAMVGFQGLINGNISLYDQDDLKFFEDFSSDEEFKKLIVSKLKDNMLEGTMTKGEAQAALNDIDLVAGIFNSIDENLPQGAKLEAFNLINEKRRLLIEVEGKDPALSKKRNDRIAEINQELEELPSRVQEDNLTTRGRNIEYALEQGKGTSKTIIIDGKRVDRAAAEAELQTIKTKIEENAIQKQAASEVLVQPTTTVGEEVVQGEPTAEPQVITEEGKAQEVEYDEFTTEGINATKKLLEDSIEKFKLEENKKSRLTRIAEKLTGSVENGMIKEYQRELELLNADPLTFFKERVKKGMDSYQINVDNFKIKEKAPATQEVVSEEAIPQPENLTMREAMSLEAPVVAAPKVEAPVVEAPVAEAPVVETKEGAPTTFSWPKIKEYTSEVIRSMRQAQFAKLNPLLELKKPETKDIIKIKDLQAKIKSADAVLNARENKIKEDEKKAEKGEVTDKSPRVNGVDQNNDPAEFSIVVNEKKQTAQVQLKKRGGLELARQKPESDLKIQTDNKGRKFVETQNKSRVYIDEKVTPPKAEVKAPTPKAAPKAKAAPKEAPIVEAKAEPVVEVKAEPVKKPTVTAEDTMGVINSIKEDIEKTTNEIKETRAKARKAVNEIEAKILDTKNENQKEELQFDIVDIETQLEEDLEGLKDDLDRQVAMLKEEVESLKDLDIKKPENKKTLLSYIDGAIATLNSLNKLTYAKLDAGVTLGTLKLILQGIRAGVVAGKGFNTAVRAMATKYKNEHDNKKITIDEFIKEINDYLDSTYVDPQTYKESLEEEIDKFAEIKNAVKQAQSKSIELRKKASNTIKDMLKGKFKSISAVHMKSIMTRLVSVKVENQTQYDKFLDYVDKVIEIANYDTKVKEANAKRKNAKKNTVGNNPKLGDLSLDLLGSLSRMLNINAKLISKEVFDSYYDIVDDLSKGTTILSPGERADLNIKVNEIVDSIEQNEDMLPDLKDAYDNFADKVVENGVVNYAKTLTKMLEDGVINNKEFALMKKYKSRIVDAKIKVKMTPAEEAAEKTELINEIINTPMTLDAIVGDEFRLERELAKRLARLINKESLENLENKELKDLLKIIDNINSGFVSKSTQQMVEKLNETQKSPLLVKNIPKSVKGIFKKISQPFTGLFTRDKYGTNITPLFNIDEVFGDFKNKNIFNSVFEQSAVSQQQYQSEVSEIQGKLVKAESAIASSFNRNENKVVLSKFKMMVYMMQLEYNSNPNSQKGDKRQVHQAMKTLDATIKFAETNRKKSRYTKEDIKQMKAIKEEFEKNDGFEEDGKTIKKIIDIDKLYNSFNEAEKNALKVFDEVNSLMTKKAAYTATVINGNKIVPLKNYIYYNTISDPSTSAEQATNLINNINNNMKPGTESKNLQERSGLVSPVNLDPFFAVNSSAKSVLINYHMTEPIRTARKTLSNARKILEKNKEEKIDVGEQFEILSVIEEAYDTATKDLLETNFSESSNLKSVAQYLTKAGYRAMLGSVTRASAELVSNAAFVTINNPKDMAAGFKYRGIANSGRGKNILTNLKSKVISRNYPQGGLSSNYVDLSSFTDRTTRDGKSRTKYVNGVKQVFDYTVGEWVNFAELVADNLISRPDQIVMKQLYFGAFSREFEKETGIEPDFEKIEANDEEYMDKYKDALEKATNEADNQTVTAGSSMNAYMGTLQNVVRKGDSGAKAGLKTFNQFMNRFTVQEYITARKGVNAAIGRGDMTPAEGRQVLAAVATRMTLYLTLGKVFSQALMYLGGVVFGYGDDDDDDEKTNLQILYQSAVSSATTLFFGRNFGNVVRSIENYFIEQANKEYGEDIGLRNKEYDPFKDAVQYNQFEKVEDVPDVFALMAGPLGPVINAGTLALKLRNKEAPKEDRAIETRRKEWYRLGLEAAGSFGLVPFYRDVRKVTMDWVYDELKKEQKEKAEKKVIEDEKDATTLETKTNTLNRMRDIYKDGRSRSIIDDELRKLTDPKFKKQEKDKEDADRKRLLDKYGYDSQEDFERNEKEKYKKVFGDDSPYKKRMAAKAKIRQELKDRMDAAEDRKVYKPKKEKEKKPVDAFESDAFKSDAFESDAFESDAFKSDAFGKKRRRN